MNTASSLFLRSVLVAALVVPGFTGCRTAAESGRHQPAKAGERVGQVTGVRGMKVEVSIDESCLVHAGDTLSVRRLFCEPGAGRKDTKGCSVFESGTISVLSVNAADHTASGRLIEGTAAVDAPVFMTEKAAIH